MKPLIYIAGPYTNPDPVENTHHAIRVGEYIETFGCAVVIPHLSLIWHLVKPAPLETWYERDLHVLERCDAVFRFNGASTGADRECEHADKFHIPVFFESEQNMIPFVQWRDKWQATR